LAVTLKGVAADFIHTIEQLLYRADIRSDAVRQPMALNGWAQVARRDGEHGAVIIGLAARGDRLGDGQERGFEVLTAVAAVTWAHSTLALQAHGCPLGEATATVKGLTPGVHALKCDVIERREVRLRGVSSDGAEKAPKAATDRELEHDAAVRGIAARTRVEEQGVGLSQGALTGACCGFSVLYFSL